MKKEKKNLIRAALESSTGPVRKTRCSKQSSGGFSTLTCSTPIGEWRLLRLLVFFVIIPPDDENISIDLQEDGPDERVHSGKGVGDLVPAHKRGAGGHAERLRLHSADVVLHLWPGLQAFLLSLSLSLSFLWCVL